MNKLPKDKRDRLLLVAIGTVAVCVGIWFGLINTQKRVLVNLARLTQEQQSKVDNANRLVNNSTQIARNLDSISQKLKSCEDTMASGDMYSWIILTINKFKAPYRVDIPQFSREIPCEVGVLPRFPYRAALYNVRGTAHFHDLGRFIADFENAFPFVRVQNLELDSAANSTTTGEDSEKLSFRMEIITLINPHVR
jgi:hypothetical protein